MEQLCKQRLLEQLDNIEERRVPMNTLPLPPRFEFKMEFPSEFQRSASSKVAIIDHTPNWRGEDLILNATLEMIRFARATIDIGHCYFVGFEAVYEELRQAVLRGVVVRYISNAHEVNDLPVYSQAMVSSCKPLLDAGMFIPLSCSEDIFCNAAPGVRVWLKRSMPNLYHCKFLIVDSKMVNVGSWNFWAVSSFYECECNAVVHDETFAREMTAEFERHLKMCDEIRKDNLSGLLIPQNTFEQFVLSLFVPWSFWKYGI